MALANRHSGGKGVMKANGGKCPEGVHFIEYENPYGNGLPQAYDDTASGMDQNVKETLSDIKRAWKPQRP